MLRSMAVTIALALLAVGCSDQGIDVAGGDATIDLSVDPLEDAPVARRADAAIAWTGTEFLVTGGVVGDEKFGDDGEPETEDDGPVEAMASEGQELVGTMPVHAFDPVLGSWRTPSPSPLDARARHVAVWTGAEVLVWGGTARRNGVGDLLDAAAWDPATDTWRVLPDSPAGTDRSHAEAVVLGRFVVIGGGAGPKSGSDGRLLAFDLAEETWTVLPGDGPVLDLHDAGDGTVLVLRSRGTGQDTEYFVGRLRVDEQDGLVDELAASPLSDPSFSEGAPPEAFPQSVGLMGAGDRVVLVTAPANDLASVYPVPPVGVREWTDTPVRVAGLGAAASDMQLGNSPVLAVDGAVLPFGLGMRGDVAYEPADGTARRVEGGDAISCRNGRSWAIGAERLLLVGGDCGGEVVTAAARG